MDDFDKDYVGEYVLGEMYGISVKLCKIRKSKS